METEIIDQNPEFLEKKRPTMLTVLCVLTFIMSGLALLGSLVMVLFGGKIANLMTSEIDSMDEEEAAEVLKSSENFDNPAFWVFMIALVTLSLIGAIMMWKLKKKGFFIYTGANVLGIILPLVIFHQEVSWPGIIITIIFIGLYAMNLKHMHNN